MLEEEEEARGGRGDTRVKGQLERKERIPGEENDPKEEEDVMMEKEARRR